MLQVTMTAREPWNLSLVSDEQLLQDLSGLLAGGARVEARIVAHLAEVEERRLHLKAATSSMFDYCLRRLGLSESEAFHRITAARLARRFPVILELLEDRSIHLSALRILRDHLTGDNHRELLAKASGRSKHEVESIVAGLDPRPDVQSRIRKLPSARRRALVSPASANVSSIESVSFVSESATATPATLAAFERGQGKPLDLEAAMTDTNSAAAVPSVAELHTGAAASAPLVTTRIAFNGADRTHHHSQHRNALPSGGDPEAPPPRRSGTTRTLEPLSADRYLLRVTLSYELKEKVERARALMSHANPSGELALVLERSLDLLLEKLEKQRFAQTKRPRRAHPRSLHPKAPTSERPVKAVADSAETHTVQSHSAKTQTAETHSTESHSANTQTAQAQSSLSVSTRKATREHIPNEIRRAVALRDGERCTYVDGAGRRCEGRAFLQLHHEFAHALGGASTIDNLRLLCAGHNRLLAERDFGRLHQERFIRRQPRSSASRCTPCAPGLTDGSKTTA